MAEPNNTEGWSVHFQLLVVGTLVFLAALFWSTDGTMPQILNGLWAIGGYLAFVVLVGGHALLRNGQRRE